MVGDWLNFVTEHGLEVHWNQRRAVIGLSKVSNHISMCIRSIRTDFEDRFKGLTRDVKPNYLLDVITSEKHAAAVEANKAVNAKVNRYGPYARQRELKTKDCDLGTLWNIHQEKETDCQTVSTQPDVEPSADPLSPADQKLDFDNIDYHSSDFDDHADFAASTARPSTRPRTSAPQQRVTPGRVRNTASDKNKANTTYKVDTTNEANTIGRNRSRRINSLAQGSL